MASDFGDALRVGGRSAAASISIVNDEGWVDDCVVDAHTHDRPCLVLDKRAILFRQSPNERIQLDH